MYRPKRVLFEQDALEYPLGKELYQRFKEEKVLTKVLPAHNRVTGIPGKTPQQAYMEAKKTLVVGVRKTLSFQSCKPSANYQLPLVTSCPGMCQYCYLQTTLGKKPYLRIYVNQEEILKKAKEYIEKRAPEITVFEGAATSDPLAVEPYSKALENTISFFAKEKLGRFRFVTKFTGVDSLLSLDHGGHTRFRFSINTDRIIKQFEQGTPSANLRIEASGKVARAKYPMGFIIAPVIIYEDWKNEYDEMLRQLSEKLPSDCKDLDLKFEVIAHRFTKRAKANIEQVFPDSQLPMDESERKLKYGQFGYTKYVYPKENYEELKEFFRLKLEKYFPEAQLDYLV
ncbi:spore photoproduct lyase [Desulfitispora alkaliphila]|uniref:spore photoproduct lyase n=1 Tax=Desulfitispora alkaliphila TaxID=622674 RepID=UPI003D19511A